MSKIRFSVITVCLNPGLKLKTTVDSVLAQDYEDLEIVIKDGGSSDGSVDAYRAGTDPRIKYVFTTDSGIYEAMNQAVEYATGDYVLFLNAGDRFYDTKVLSKAADELESFRESYEAADSHGPGRPGIIAYGDAYFERTRSFNRTPSVLTASYLYGNLPCHQAMIYSRNIFERRGYDTGFRVRGDYEHLLYNFFRTDTEFKHLNMTICTYEGGGVSESRKGRELDAEERAKILKIYYSGRERFRQEAVRVITLSKFRRWLNENPVTSGVYQRFRNLFVK